MADIIICDNCRYEFEKYLIDRKPVRGIIEKGFYCPQCKKWYHGWYTNSKLERERKKFKLARVRHSKAKYATEKKARQAIDKLSAQQEQFKIAYKKFQEYARQQM